MNIIILTGNAGKDPEVKYLDSGKVVAKFSLAVSRTSKNKDGQYDTDWFDLEMWDKTAEVAANYIKKGSKLGIKGRLEFQSWEDKETGKQRKSAVVKVESLELMGSKNDDSSNSGSNGSKPASQMSKKEALAAASKAAVDDWDGEF